MTQNQVIVFFVLIVFSGCELSVENKCEFSSFLWVRASLVESQQMSSFVFISFLRLSCCIHFLSRAFHFAFMSHSFPFILLSCPFMFRRYVSKIQVFESWYAQTGHVGIHPNTPFFCICRSVIVELSFWRPVQVAIFRFHEHVHV